MLTVTLDVQHRLTRPKDFPGVYVPWMADEGFIWKRLDEVEVDGDTLDALAAKVKGTAEKMMADYGGDDLEAVKLDGRVEVGGVDVRFDVLLEKE